MLQTLNPKSKTRPLFFFAPVGYPQPGGDSSLQHRADNPEKSIPGFRVEGLGVEDFGGLGFTAASLRGLDCRYLNPTTPQKYAK